MFWLFNCWWFVLVSTVFAVYGVGFSAIRGLIVFGLLGLFVLLLCSYCLLGYFGGFWLISV